MVSNMGRILICSLGKLRFSTTTWCLNGEFHARSNLLEAWAKEETAIKWCLNDLETLKMVSLTEITLIEKLPTFLSIGSKVMTNSSQTSIRNSQNSSMNKGRSFNWLTINLELTNNHHCISLVMILAYETDPALLSSIISSLCPYLTSELLNLYSLSTSFKASKKILIGCCPHIVFPV